MINKKAKLAFETIQEAALAHEVDQPCHRLAGIDRIKQHALKLGEHADRLDRVGARDAVSLAHIIGVGHDILAPHDIRAAQLFGSAPGKGEDVFLLLGPGGADTET